MASGSAARSFRSRLLSRNPEEYKRNWGAIPGVLLPIVQAPMAGCNTPKLTIAACQAGCIGSLGASPMAGEQLREAIRSVKAGVTTEGVVLPFNLNLFITDDYAECATDSDRHRAEAAKDFVASMEQRAFGANGSTSPLPKTFAVPLEEQFQVVLEEGVPIFSTTFGALKAEWVRSLQEKWGTIVVGSATSVDEYFALKATGVDAVVLQGKEAGGHRGSFLKKQGAGSGGSGSVDDIIWSMEPVRRLVAAVRAAEKERSGHALPLLSAGGILDSSDVDELLLRPEQGGAGADAVVIGTGFLNTSDCEIPLAYKLALHNLKAEGALVEGDGEDHRAPFRPELCPPSANPDNKSGLESGSNDFRIASTFCISGRKATGISNRLMEDGERFFLEDDIYPRYPILNKLTGGIRGSSGKAGSPEYLSLRAGYGAHKLAADVFPLNISCAEYVQQLAKHSTAISCENARL